MAGHSPQAGQKSGGKIKTPQRVQTESRRPNKRVGSRGKVETQIEVYQEKCERKLAELQVRMDSITDKRSALWKSLKKRKHSYESRLQVRLQRQNNFDSLDRFDQVIELLTKEALAVVPAATRQALSDALDLERSRPINSFLSPKKGPEK